MELPSLKETLAEPRVLLSRKVGTLTSGNLSFSSTGLYEWELKDGLGVAGTTDGGWALTAVNGNFKFQPRVQTGSDVAGPR